MSNNADVIEIPVTDLAKGMQVYRRDRYGNLKQDFRVGDPFTTSGPSRLQPIAFYTDKGAKVFAQCATVEVSTGRQESSHRTSMSQRPNGKARRKNRKVGIR